MRLILDGELSFQPPGSHAWIFFFLFLRSLLSIYCISQSILYFLRFSGCASSPFIPSLFIFMMEILALVGALKYDTI